MVNTCSPLGYVHAVTDQNGLDQRSRHREDSDNGEFAVFAHMRHTPINILFVRPDGLGETHHGVSVRMVGPSCYVLHATHTAFLETFN